MNGVSVPRVVGTMRRLATAWLDLPHVVRSLLPAAVMVALWWSSSRVPTPREPDVVRGLFHNAMHVVAYAVLAATVWLAIAVAPLAPARKWWAPSAWLVAVLYGAVDEIHQAFVPGRTSSVVDLVTDMCGAAFALLVLAWVLCGAASAARGALLCLVAGCASAVLATFGPW